MNEIFRTNEFAIEVLAKGGFLDHDNGYGEMTNMDQDLRSHIDEIFDGGSWEKLTGVLWEKGTPWQLFKFEHDVDFGGKLYRCVVISKNILDPDDIEAVDCAVDVLSSSWEI